MKIRAEKVLLFFLLILAAVLRFYHIKDIPFTHDEFSALFRTQFQGFQELIQKGVLPDFHPAGVQIFLYYYLKLTGPVEWMVKLPFILAGIGSVYIIFEIGRDWFNERTALLAAAFIGVTQYFIFYSQMARPYAPGLFFGLLAMFFWGKLVLSKDKMHSLYFFGWIFSAAICAYTHYYLLLTLVLLSLIGVFIISRKYLLRYLLSGAGIVLLYIPHFPVFFAQVSKGGVGTWLGKPTPAYVMDYFRYVFEFVPAFLIFTGLIVLIGIFTSLRKIRLGAMWWTGILLFILSLGTGYVYSLVINPIFQFSGLIFSLPLLLLSVFYFTSLRKWIFYTAFSGIILFGVYGLIYERQHFEIFYDSPFEELTKDIKEKTEGETENSLILLDGRKDIMRFYLERYEVDTSRLILLSGLNLTQLVQEIKKSKSNDLLLGTTSLSVPEVFAIAHHFYPYIKDKKTYADGEFFHLSVDSAEPVSEYIIWQKTLQIGSPELPEYFNRPDTNSVITDSINGKSWFVFNDQREYGLGAGIPYGVDSLKNKNRFLDIVAGIRSANPLKDAMICTAIMEGDSTVNWNSSLMEFAPLKGGTFTAFHTLNLDQNTINKYKDPYIKIFIWNRGKEDFLVSDMKIQFRKGNPKMYSLYEDILKE